MKVSAKLEILSLVFSDPKDFSLGVLEDKGLEGVLIEVLGQDFANKFSNQAYREEIKNYLAHDYLYLFRGASKPLASPYASSYYRKDSRLMDKPAANIINIMKRWGLDLDEENKDLPDHVANICAILAFFLDQIDSTEEPILKEELSRDTDRIVNELSFIDDLYERIKANEKVAFYSLAALALKDTLREIKPA